MDFRIVVAVDGSSGSKKAIEYAADLYSRCACSCKIEILYCIGINPPKGTTALHLLSGLDRINNIEIKQEAMEEVAELKKFIAQFNIKNIEFITKEGSSHVGSIIEEYINQNPPNMLVLGSSNKEGLEKFILGSVSDYCLHHCQCPVTIIKSK